MINHLCHMGGRYFVTMIPGRMEMYWGSMLMCATYMAMFWGITLWLAVCVRCVVLVEGCLGSRVGYQGIPDLGRVCEWSVSDQLAREFPNWNEHHWKRTRSYSSLEKTDSKPIHICVSKIIIIGSDNDNNNHHCFRVSRDVPPFRPLFHLRYTLWLGIQMSNILLLDIILSFWATLFGLGWKVMSRTPHPYPFRAKVRRILEVLR